ncbi:MAG: hypothetical protein IPK03_05515 [Bacteroidetes bacterium]|nr:hypothetical protein [Bacteroidota bacterium]
MKAKYSEDTLTNAFKKLDKANEQLKTIDGINLYFQEVNNKRYNKAIETVKDLVNISIADGEITKNEANTIIAKAIECDLSETEIREYLLNLIKEKGYKPRATKTNPDPFDNRWMTDEKWKEAQSRFTTINGVPVSSLEEYGEVLFSNEEYATKHLKTINYITQEVTKLHSTDKAMEFEEIIETESDVDKRNLKVIYHLNPSIPFRINGVLNTFKSVNELFEKGFSEFEIYQKITLLFSIEHIQIWLKESDPTNASKLPNKTDYRSFLEFIYKVDDSFPFYLKQEIIATPIELVQKIKNLKSYWFTTIDYIKNGNIPTWFLGVGQSYWLDAYNNSVDKIINSKLHNDEESNLASIQSLAQIIDPTTSQPTLNPDKDSISLTEIEGSDEIILESLVITIQNTGFVKAKFYLDNNFEGVKLDTDEFAFFTQDNKNSVSINLIIDSSKLEKDNLYEFNVIVETLFETLSVPTKLKAVFPKRAFIIMLVKYAVVFMIFFGIVRYSFNYEFNPFLILMVFIGGLIGSVFAIKKFEKL